MTAAAQRVATTAGPRSRLLALSAVSLLIVAALAVGAPLLGDYGVHADFAARMLPPSLDHPFGTDVLGRDMLARTVKGLTVSLWVGLLAASVSALVAVVLAVTASLDRRADAAVSFLVDMGLGLPHLVLLILISFALGGGTTAVIVAVALTHWPRLTRILRAEILQAMEADYIRVARRLGASRLAVARRHLVPHLMPQLLVGFLLLFPHAILHEAALTFLGFGLEPDKPAIGILLSDSMRYLTAGYWWLGLFPGAALVGLVLCSDAIANGLRTLTDPRSSQE